MFTLNTYPLINSLNGKKLFGFSLLSLACFSAVAANSPSNQNQGQKASVLGFSQSIKIAQKNDPWLTGNKHKQKAIEAMSSVATTLPDPKVSIALANLPTDGFDFNQEGMTQLKVGITQVIPRGDTLALKSEQLKIKSQAYPFQRENRKDQVLVTVGQLWLDAYRAQESVKLIENDRALFSQLADVAQASYSSAVGKTRQQDIIRAQLELTRLDDRLDKLEQQKNHFQGQLSQWLIAPQNKTNSRTNSQTNESLNFVTMTFAEKLPAIDLIKSELVLNEQYQQPESLVRYFNRHPAVIALDNKIAATKTGISIAKQKYKPQWAVNGSYGYRADAPNGNTRADLMSVGVTFDVPLFTENRQDKEVDAAVYETEAIKTEKLLLLRKFIGAFNSGKGRLLRLRDRQTLYQTTLLPQMRDQAEASLNAYTNDDGDFAEVVRARIAVLNAEIEQLSLNVEQQKINLTLNYLFAGSLAVNQ